MYVPTAKKFCESPWHADISGEMAPTNAICFAGLRFLNFLCIEPALRIGAWLILIRLNCSILDQIGHGILLLMSFFGGLAAACPQRSQSEPLECLGILQDA